VEEVLSALPEITALSLFLASVPPSRATLADGWNELEVVLLIRRLTKELLSDNHLYAGGYSCCLFGVLKFLASRFSLSKYNIAELTSTIEQIYEILSPLFDREPFWVDDGWLGGVFLFIWYAWRRLPPPPPPPSDDADDSQPEPSTSDTISW